MRKDMTLPMLLAMVIDRMILEGLLTLQMLWYIIYYLSVPQGPQVSKPGTLTRQSLVPGFSI